MGKGFLSLSDKSPISHECQNMCHKQENGRCCLSFPSFLFMWVKSLNAEYLCPCQPGIPGWSRSGLLGMMWSSPEHVSPFQGQHRWCFLSVLSIPCSLCSQDQLCGRDPTLTDELINILTELTQLSKTTNAKVALRARQVRDPCPAWGSPLWEIHPSWCLFWSLCKWGRVGSCEQHFDSRAN